MSTPTSSQQRVPCPSCGTPNPANAQFCGNCGASVQAVNQAPSMQNSQPSFTPPPNFNQQQGYTQQANYNTQPPNFNPQPNWNQQQQFNPQPNWNPQQGYNQQQPWNQGGYAQGVRYGSFGVRVVALLIDAVIIYAIQYMLGGLISFFAGAAYYIGCWGGMGQTLGMKVFKLRVVDANTMQKIDWGKAVIRYLGFMVDILTLFIGFLMALWDPRAQCIHDKIAGTLVVQDQ